MYRVVKSIIGSAKTEPVYPNQTPITMLDQLLPYFRPFLDLREMFAISELNASCNIAVATEFRENPGLVAGHLLKQVVEDRWEEFVLPGFDFNKTAWMLGAFYKGDSRVYLARLLCFQPGGTPTMDDFLTRKQQYAEFFDALFHRSSSNFTSIAGSWFFSRAVLVEMVARLLDSSWCESCIALPGKSVCSQCFQDDCLVSSVKHSLCADCIPVVALPWKHFCTSHNGYCMGYYHFSQNRCPCDCHD